jgi:hypothetical protein
VRLGESARREVVASKIGGAVSDHHQLGVRRRAAGACPNGPTVGGELLGVARVAAAAAVVARHVGEDEPRVDAAGGELEEEAPDPAREDRRAAGGERERIGGDVHGGGLGGEVGGEGGDERATGADQRERSESRAAHGRLGRPGGVMFWRRYWRIQTL